MAKTVRDAKLESRTARAALKKSGKPYYRAIETGLHLGYRKNVHGGVWLMRRNVGGAKVYEFEQIGTADDARDADGETVFTFAQAQAVARKRSTEAQRIAAGLPADSGPYTVRACVDEYLQWLDDNKKSGKDSRWRSEALIYPSLGDIVCNKLSNTQIRKWLDATAKSPARLRSKTGEPARFGILDLTDSEEARKRKASANRVLTILKASLNRAWGENKIPSDEPWRKVKPFKGADAARVRYLSVVECQRLTNASPKDFRCLVQGALATGCRYGELAALQVRDFNPDSGTLHIQTSKSGLGRHVVLTEEGIEQFKALTVGRDGGALLLLKGTGGAWIKNHQVRPIAEACEIAKITPAISFHILRHTYASLSLMNEVPLMVVAQNLGHVNTTMVTKHYGHLSANYVAAAVRAGAPRFGISQPTNVVNLARG